MAKVLSIVTTVSILSVIRRDLQRRVSVNSTKLSCLRRIPSTIIVSAVNSSQMRASTEIIPSRNLCLWLVDLPGLVSTWNRVFCMSSLTTNRQVSPRLQCFGFPTTLAEHGRSPTDKIARRFVGRPCGHAGAVPVHDWQKQELARRNSNLLTSPRGCPGKR